MVERQNIFPEGLSKRVVKGHCSTRRS